MFIFRETLRFLRHHFGWWLMACITLGVALGVSGLFALLAWRAHSAMAELRANLAIEAFFDPGISSGDAAAIAQSTIESLPGVSRVIFISKEQALRDYTTSSGEDVANVLGMNPLPASVKIYLRDPSAKSAESTEAALRAVQKIEEVRGNYSLLQTMESRSRVLDNIAILLSSLLLLSALFYALLAGRHSFEISRDTLRTFDLLGATRFASIAPITIATAAAGLAGGTLGWALTWAASKQAVRFLDPALTVSLSGAESFVWLGVLAGAGFIIGTLGAVLSASRRNIFE